MSLYFVFVIGLTELVMGQELPADVYSIVGTGGEKLVEILEGKSLVCNALEKSGKRMVEKGYYPLSFSAIETSKEVLVTVRTKDPAVGAGFGGNDFGLELSPGWIQLSIGDDGRRYLSIMYYPGFAENVCKGSGVGGITGFNSTVWDSRTVTTHAMHCCFK